MYIKEFLTCYLYFLNENFLYFKRVQLLHKQSNFSICVCSCHTTFILLDIFKIWHPDLYNTFRFNFKYKN